MSSDYDGVKFYSSHDLSIGWNLEKAEPILHAFFPDKMFDSMNEIIELYNIKELIDLDRPLRRWSTETYKEYKTKVKLFTAIIAKYFSRINNENFIEIVHNVDIHYLKDFWTLFENYKAYEHVEDEIFKEYLLLSKISLLEILKHEKLVKAYNGQLAELLRTSDQTCEILVACYLAEQENTRYYIPSLLKPEEFELIFQKFIDSVDPSPNTLRLIIHSQSSRECPISDRIKLNAKKKYEEFWSGRDSKVSHVGYKYSISLIEQEEYQKCINDEHGIYISYDRKWLEENLDYPTILNNFFYVFEMFDRFWRSTLPSLKVKMDVLESITANNGKNAYPRGSWYLSRNIIASLQMGMYKALLEEHRINLEDVFVWFFTEYLQNEFNTYGFFMQSSNSSNYAEKCRTLVSEMDGILKQFRMYAQDGVVDRELYEMSSAPLSFESIPSLIGEKYAYACTELIQQEMNALFSLQSEVAYVEKFGSKYSSLFEILTNEKVSVEDFAPFQEPVLKWLIDRGTILLNHDGTISYDGERAFLLRELYEHEVICVNYLSTTRFALKEMINAEDIRIEGTLFSIPEKNYLNFMLNKSQYSDGLDIRNKYAHSTYTINKDVQQMDYIELLKIMVLIVTKINEEFCLREDRLREEAYGL